MQKYDYDCLMREVGRLEERYAGKLEVGVAGESVCGRKLVTLSVGQGEKTLFMLGTHHGREYVTAAYLMRLCENYLETAEEVLFQRCRLVLLPMVNPDGAELSIRGEVAADDRQRRMPRLNGTYSSWKANANGVDLNRNYPCLWERKAVLIDEPASEMYNGPRAASEPEVRAVMCFTEQLAPDLAVTMHTKGEEIYYADANTPEVAAESLKYAERIRALTGYRIMPSSRDAAVYAAGYENWFRERFRKPCLLLEAGRYDGPEPFRERLFETEIWQKLGKVGTELLFLLISV